MVYRISAHLSTQKTLPLGEVITVLCIVCVTKCYDRINIRVQYYPH